MTIDQGELRARGDLRDRPPLGAVLVATDFEPHAASALDRALHLRQGGGSTLELCHVLDDPSAPAVAARREEEAARQLEDVRARAAQLLAARGDDRRLVVALAHGRAVAQIVDRAHHGRAELIVLGRHGAPRLGDVVLGSTAARVIRTGSVSVLVVAAPAIAAYRRPLVAIDGSPSSRLALELAARVCDPSVVEIDVVHVIARAGPATGDEGLIDPGQAIGIVDERHARIEFTELVAGLEVAARWNLIIRSGDPETEILDEARLRNSDLLALGTVGRTGLRRALIGSVAERVLAAATRDVLVARLPGD
ncbi:MAG: universal stress protein [Myxococcales bacterium]|nr:universal stress protein [Myxococcales bacterium]